VKRALLATAIAVAALIGLASPASAHATLQDTTPRNGEHLDAGPKEVSLHFSESVEVSLGAVRVYNAKGTRLDQGAIVHPNGDASTVVVGLPTLRDGAYVVTWRVVSADSHPVQGAFTFVVGNAKAVNDTDVAGLLAERGGSHAVGVLYGVGRSLAFAAMLLLLGGAAFVLLCWPDGATARGVQRTLIGALVVLFVVTVANLGLQGAYGGGLGLGDAFTSSVVRNVLDTRLGHVYFARLVLLVVAMPVLLWMRNPVLPPMFRWVAFAVGVAIAATPGLAGHAAIGSHEPYALWADVAHVSAASVWIGGIVFLVAFVLPQGSSEVVKTVVRRYSQVAFAAVTVLVATGLFQGYRQVGTIDALRTTTYGRLLFIKAGLVLAMLGLAWLSRRATRAKWLADTTARIRRTVALEMAFAIAVVSVTGLLVNAVPAKVLAAAPQSGELTSATLLVDYTVSPGRAGVNEIHLYTLTKAGQPQPVVEMTLKLSLPDKGIAAIPVDLEVAGPGHYQSLRFQLPIKGRWRMDVTARTSDIDAEVFDGTVDIR
jgi:copper transport protein